jgi:hypothetical protein
MQGTEWARFLVPATGGAFSDYGTSLEILDHKWRDAFFAALASRYKRSRKRGSPGRHPALLDGLASSHFCARCALARQITRAAK